MIIHEEFMIILFSILESIEFWTIRLVDLIFLKSTLYNKYMSKFIEA